MASASTAAAPVATFRQPPWAHSYARTSGLDRFTPVPVVLERLISLLLFSTNFAPPCVKWKTILAGGCTKFVLPEEKRGG